MQTNTNTNFEEMVPPGILYSLLELEQLKIIKVPMAKKLIRNGKLEHVKIGTKIFITRDEVIRYLSENTIERYGRES